ncbi:hypothetical protein OH687_07875 [Burkholderia anthina]|nr:hypothetical protein OH687_07875 [Burkholderia anthina]
MQSRPLAGFLFTRIRQYIKTPDRAFTNIYKLSIARLSAN